jgi:hypothetical protein
MRCYQSPGAIDFVVTKKKARRWSVIYRLPAAEVVIAIELLH